LKCDILIHLPSGIAFTGRSEEDTFIGSIAYLLYPLEKLVSMPKEDAKKIVRSETKMVQLPIGDQFTYLPFVEKGRESLEATLGPDALILTWKGKKGPGTERIRYSDMTSALLVDIKPKEPSPRARAASIALGALAAGPIGAAAAATRTFPSYQLLRVKTTSRDYQMFVPQAADWVDRLREQGVNAGRTDGVLSENPEER
jgi:hypothetical protein